MVDVDTRDFKYLKVGDTVTRLLAGQVPMLMRVTKITDDKVYATCAEPDFATTELLGDDGWVFDRLTGVEIDDRWPNVISYLIHGSDPNEDDGEVSWPT